jgi:hypothetical protein
MVEMLIGWIVVSAAFVAGWVCHAAVARVCTSPMPDHELGLEGRGKGQGLI